MADQNLNKNDIAAVFKRLRSIQSNKICFDCGAKNPTWASVTYGVFICMDCSAVHRSLGVHLSFVRSTQLDTNWTWLQLRAMQVGGNAAATSFFRQHGCSSSDAQQKYNSRAAQLYREKLHHQAAAAMRLHGTKLHIESQHVESPASPEKKDVDFFEHLEQAHLGYRGVQNNENQDLQNGSCLKNSTSNEIKDINPSLEIPADFCETAAQPTRKSTIAGRKPLAKKPGAKRSGLGAQRVSANFVEIEKEAEQMDRIKEKAEVVPEVSEEEQQKQIASVRLAYKDLSVQQKETEDKLRQTDPRKAEQLERLGMGFGLRNAGSVAHSAASEMKLITQETPNRRSIDLDEDFEFMSFTTGPPKYGDSPFLSRSSSERLNEITGKGSWVNEKMEKRSPSENLLSSKDTSSRPKKSTLYSNVSQTDEAQKKFGNAKGISSEQFFGPSKDSELERQANLSRFEGSSSISSEDYFGDGRRNPSSYGGPNLYDIREGVRDGVTKVAGRLSNIANGVMSSLQDRYGY